MAKALFFKLMNEKYEPAKNLSCLLQLDSVKGAIRTKVFHTKYLKRKHYKILICYFHKFSVYDNLHEHYCTFELLVGKTLREIEYAVAKTNKKCAILFLSKYSASSNFLPLSKGYLKTGPLPRSKMKLALTIINDSPIYAKSPVLARRLPSLSSVNHIIVIL